MTQNRDTDVGGDRGANVYLIGGAGQPASLGQKAMAASSPVVIASDQTALQVKGDSSALSTLTAGALNADLVPSTDVSAYARFSLQVEGTFSGTLSFQGSNDNTNWQNVLVNNVTNASGVVGSTQNGAGIYSGFVNFRYLRVRMTSYTSGTATGTLMLYALGGGSLVATVQAGQTGTWVIQPTTSGGLTAFKRIGTADTNAAVVKASAGQVYSLHANNVNAAARYLKLYNKATAPNVGTDVPVMTFAIPAGGIVDKEFSAGLAFSAGIAMALTTGLADADTGAVSANEHVVNLGYK